VHPTGKKTYKLSKRIHGKLTPFTIGHAAVLSLGDAREQARQLLGMIARGEDPCQAKREAAEAAAETVATVGRDFVRLYAKPNVRRWEEVERQIEKEIIPRWGARPIASIHKRDVPGLIDPIAARAPVMANRVLATVKQLFKWAAKRGLIETAPFGDYEKPATEVSRDRRHSDAELALLWRATGAIGYPFGSIVRLLILTGARKDEVGLMRWNENNADFTTWVLPASRAKNGIEHTIPLSSLARSILMALPRIGDADGFVFTTGSRGRGAFNDYSRGKIKLDEAIADLTEDGQPIPHWTLHDIRRTVASGMARLGIQLPVTEKILNHISGSFAGVAGVYQLHDFADEKRRALEIWTAHVLSLDVGSPVVVALRA
jgi:integrase